MRWVVEDLDGQAIGELCNVSNQTWRQAVSETCVASGIIDLDEPLFGELFRHARRRRLRVFDDRGGTRVYGKLTDAQLTGSRDNPSGLAFTVMDDSFELAWRYVTDADGNGETVEGYDHDDADRLALAKQWIDTTNTKYGYLAIRTRDTYPATGLVPVADMTTVPILDGLAQIGVASDGFEWQATPNSETGDGRYVDGILVANYWDAGPRLGTNRSNEVFWEFGTGLTNLSSYDCRDIGSGLANTFYSITDETAPHVITEINTASVAEFGVLQVRVEGLDSYGAELRTKQLQAHSRVRSQTQELWVVKPDTFDPDQPDRVPQVGYEFNLGDDVAARVVDVLGGVEYVLLDASMRVYGVSIAVDQNGVEDVTLELIEAGVGA